MARSILASGGIISVQVLNEFANVLHRKLRRAWGEIEEALADIAVLLPPPSPLTYATHVSAVALSRDLKFAFHDALILASALQSGCDELLSEDMQHGRAIGPLTVRNPFI